MIFEISKPSWDKYVKWEKEHNKKCPYYHTGSAGGRTSFIFTPNGLGMEIKVQCACGKNIDITDTSDW